MLFTGAGVSTATYFILHGQEEEDEHAAYELAVRTITDSSQFHIAEFYRAMRNFGETMTSQAMVQANGSSPSWPFVTFGQWEVQASQTRDQAFVERLAVCPLVSADNLTAWNDYSVQHQGWMAESREILQLPPLSTSDRILPEVYDLAVPWDWSSVTPVRKEEGPFWPLWLHSPPPLPQMVNMNFINGNLIEHAAAAMEAKEGIFSKTADLSEDLDAAESIVLAEHDQFHDQFADDLTETPASEHPHATFLQPIFANIRDSSTVVAMGIALVPWDPYLAQLLPEGVKGITAVLRNSCGEEFTYMLNGPKSSFMGKGDLHEPSKTHTERVIPLYDFLDIETADKPGHCIYSFSIYSSSEFQSNTDDSNIDTVFPMGIAATFLGMAIAFFVYEWFVQRRNAKVVKAATQSNQVLASLFPAAVRERLIAEADTDNHSESEADGGNLQQTFLDYYRKNPVWNIQNALKHYREEGTTAQSKSKSKPIADFFPETTVLFADIVGFTAWSSVREPYLVFELLETLFHAFDEIAKRRNVFKVETVGDCYVAVAGLPTPRRDHAIVMARFARDVMLRMRALTKELETSLGPDTGELCLRIGLHSGPVTGGVLRGERSRFQEWKAPECLSGSKLVRRLLLFLRIMARRVG